MKTEIMAEKHQVQTDANNDLARSYAHRLLQIMHAVTGTLALSRYPVSSHRAAGYRSEGAIALRIYSYH